ncbi:MAG: serine/threonine-protein kinase [Planctomycetota bacterium]
MIGQQLGRYTIDAELGSGGMGTVYRAMGPEGPVAVKVVQRHLLATPSFDQRFLREAEIGKAIQHENVVRTLDAGTCEVDGQTVQYLVMEYVQGQSLRSLLKDLGTVPETLLREIALQASAGLVAIHAASIVHRDLKPENILITDDHEIRIMDLGVAKLQEATVTLTKEGHFAGSFLYAAPEQFHGKVGPAADLYALGVVLYELAGGTNPFSRDNVGAVIQAQLTETPRPLAVRVPELSHFFSDVINTLLHKDIAQRFASAAELGSVLSEGESAAWWRKRERNRTRAARARPRVPVPADTRLYGRGAELDSLRGAWEEARAGAGRVVLIEGEAGIGKTRLVAEFVATLGDEEAHVLYGSYQAPTRSAGLSGSVLQHFGDAGLEKGLRRYLGAAPGLVPAFAAIVRHDVPPAGVAPLLSDALHACSCHLLRAMAAERPTLWVIDDLDVAPPESRAIVGAMARAAEAHRALLVLTSRPGRPPELRDSLATTARFLALELGRLGPREVIDFLTDAFHSGVLAERLGGKIAHRSDGVPLFIIEMVRELKSVGLLRRETDGTLMQTGPITDLEVPSAVKDLIEARLRELAPNERAILDVAAVQGYEFDPDLMARVREARRVYVLEALAELERRTGIVRAAGRLYRFDQNQVHEVVIGAMAAPLREEYHALLADAYAAQRAIGGEARAEDAVFLAWHRLHGTRPADGLPLLEPALAHLEGTARFDLVTELLERTLGIPDLVSGVRRVKLLLRLAQRLGQRGEPGVTEARLGEAVARAEEQGDAALRSNAHFQRAGFLYYVARIEESQLESQKALELAREAGDEVLELRASRGLGAGYYGNAEYENAVRYNEHSLEMARALGLRGDAASALMNLGSTAMRTGDVGRARAMLKAAAAEAEAPASKALATYNLGVLNLEVGQWEDSQRLLAEAVRIGRACGCRRVEGLARQAQGHRAAYDGDWQEAEQVYRDALEILREVGNPSYLAWVRLVLGEAVLEQGRDQEAQNHFTEARRLAEQARSDEYILLARAHQARFEPNSADAVRHALRAERKKGRPEDVRLAWLRLWQATGRRDDLEVAKTLLEQSLAKAPEEYRDSIRTGNRTNKAILDAWAAQ